MSYDGHEYVENLKKVETALSRILGKYQQKVKEKEEACKLREKERGQLTSKLENMRRQYERHIRNLRGEIPQLRNENQMLRPIKDRDDRNGERYRYMLKEREILREFMITLKEELVSFRKLAMDAMEDKDWQTDTTTATENDAAKYAFQFQPFDKFIEWMKTAGNASEQGSTDEGRMEEAGKLSNNKWGEDVVGKNFCARCKRPLADVGEEDAAAKGRDEAILPGGDERPSKFRSFINWICGKFRRNERE